MPNEGSPTGKECHSPYATRDTAVAPKDTSQFNVGSTYKSIDETLFSLEDVSSHSLSESSRSIRKTHSAARTIFASSSSKDIGVFSPVASTPSRGRTDLNTMSSGTPHLDHVLSFHQKLSLPALSHDGFASFAFEADTSGSHDSMNSCFGNWRFYSSGLGRAADSEIPPTSSDDASLGDSDSSQEEHHVILLSRPYSVPSVARSEPSLSVVRPVSAAQKPCLKLPIVISRKRSKSLSALPALSSGSSLSSIFISATSRQDYIRALCINSSFEARRFARCSADLSETDVSISSTTSFELVGRVKKSARNGKRTTLGSKSFTRPFGRIHKAVNRLLA